MGVLSAFAGNDAAKLDAQVIFTQVPVAAANHSPVRDPGLLQTEWLNEARLMVLATNGQLRRLAADFYSACDPDVSLDGQRVLFAGKRNRESRWTIYEVGIDGTGLRQVTQETQDCRSPIYLGSLFTIDSPEPWFTVLYVATEDYLEEGGSGRATSLYSVKMDGTERRRLTMQPGVVVDPFQMWDGRVLCAGTRALRPGQPGRLSLFGIHVDGMDYELYGAEQGRRIQRQPCALGNGLVVFVESDEPSWDGAGTLAAVREQRPHHSYRQISGAGDYLWLNPSPLTDTTMLVSRRAAHGNGNSGIYSYDTVTVAARLVYDHPEFHDVQARVVRARKQPDGRSTVVDTKYKTGKLYGLNVYTAAREMAPHLAPGTIQRLRVIEAVPAPSSAAQQKARPSLGRRLLGEAPVEPDGSFHVEIPADLPVQVQMLDTNGFALATSGWLWVKQKENRGCIGCHEDPELMPENLFVSALGRKANALTLPPEQRRTVTFQDHVMPILQARCATAECHGSADTSLPLRAKLNDVQSAKEVYARLLALDSQHKPIYVDPGQARASYLIWQLMGHNTARPWDTNHVGRKVRLMPPAEAGHRLSADELRIFREWIDLGAQWGASLPRSSDNKTVIVHR